MIVTWGDLGLGDTIVADSDVFTVVAIDEPDADGWVPTTFLVTSEGLVEHVKMSPKLLSEPIAGALYLFRAGES